MATPQLNIGASIGLIGPVDGFGDAYTLPLGLGATFAISNMVDVRAQFTFDRPDGPQHRFGSDRQRRRRRGWPRAVGRRGLPHVDWQTRCSVSDDPARLGPRGGFFMPGW